MIVFSDWRLVSNKYSLCPVTQPHSVRQVLPFISSGFFGAIFNSAFAVRNLQRQGTDTSSDPALRAERGEALKLALVVRQNFGGP
jgi:hypothetical protein